MKPELIMVEYFGAAAADGLEHCGDCWYEKNKKDPMGPRGCPRSSHSSYECCGNRPAEKENHTHIWIENTPKAIAAYTAKRLMK